MAAEPRATKPQIESSIYIGAIATAVVALLPYLNVFIVLAYIAGALVAVWHASSRSGQQLLFKDGAKLGFLSTFFGTLVAALVVDIVWLFFDYQLWQRQNAQLLLAIVGSFARPVTVDAMRDAFAQQGLKPFQWYVLLVQIIVNAIFCGIFGVLSGLIGVKVVRQRSRSLGK
jgi:hypothetical protein